ncbi:MULTISPECIES: hypothetical protein [unclassified Leucobacter]|uniref:hypothetical protein n=1 Tax=unclassified Leucobacter TaxID=2621730 RepID=UPI000620FE5D|nr:hypothetical protein [Leucobacter sp. Ag1]KKI18706.1 hypothetical protein XM48_10505 [Leucobacter sp. Ag1]
MTDNGLARLLRDVVRTVRGYTRTQQITRSSVSLVQYTEDEEGNPVAESVDVSLGDLLATVPDTAETVAGHDEDLDVLDESTSLTVEDTTDLQERGDDYADGGHEAFLEAIEALEGVQQARDEAEAAAEAAANAQTTADGKNSRRRGKTEPVAPEGGWAQGDQWVVENDAGKPVEVRVWNGTAWVPDQILADEILVLDENGTVRIGDGRISTPMMSADTYEGKVYRGGEFIGGAMRGSVFELLGVSGTQTLLSDSGSTANIGKWGFAAVGFPAALDNSDGRSSAPCIRTTNTSGRTDYFGIWVRTNSDIANLTATTDVVVSLWVKVPVAATAKLVYGTIAAAPVPVAANTWTQLTLPIPKGADPTAWLVVDITGAALTYALADDLTVTGNLYDARSILINRLADGTPGVRVLDSEGRVITTLDPTGFVSKGTTAGSARAKLTAGRLEFDQQDGKEPTFYMDPNGIQAKNSTQRLVIQKIVDDELGNPTIILSSRYDTTSGHASIVLNGAAGSLTLSADKIYSRNPWNAAENLVGAFSDYNSTVDRVYFGGGDGAGPTTADHTYFAMQHGSGTTDTQSVAWIQSNVGGAGRQVFAVRRSGHIVNPHGPFAMAAGAQASVSVGAGGVGRVTVNYPAGRFTVAPLVTGSISNGMRDITFSTETPRTTSSFVAVCGNTGSVVRTVDFHWQAIQMSPSSASG